MKLVSVAEMIAIEKEADQGGLSYAEMMENAGAGLAAEILRIFGLSYNQDDVREVLGLVGPGNNGGDTLVALTYLAQQGWQTTAYLVRRREDELVARFRSSGGRVLLAAEDADFEALAASLAGADVLLDGLLGTGFKLPLRETMAQVMSAVNEVLSELDLPPFVVAVDCPSGVDNDSGAAAEVCVPADLTVTMAAVKQGLLKFPAHRYVGELRVVDIGLPSDLPALQSVSREVVDEDQVLACLPARPDDAHKGSFGTALIVAGSLNYTGAAWLSGQAAYRAGAGLVNMAVAAPLHGVLAGSFPEAVWVLLPHEMGVIAEGALDVLVDHIQKASAMLVGPGFGLEETTRRFIAGLLGGVNRKPQARIGFVHDAAADSAAAERDGASLPPLVFDADGLKLLAGLDDWPKRLPRLSVLTPHPGEMSILTGLSKEVIQADREGIARRFAAEWGQVVVLKGAFTVIAAPDGRLAVIPVATAALARAGTGDVLAGLITGLLAQGVQPFEAALTGAWIHATAGLYAADALGQTASVLAGDVLDAIPDVLADLL